MIIFIWISLPFTTLIIIKSSKAGPKTTTGKISTF